MIARAQLAFQYDSALPRDNIVLTPHYDLGSVDPATLGDWLVNSIKNATQVGTNAFTVNLYNAQTPPPNSPLYTGGQPAGVIPAHSTPREVALCSSYYADVNVPSYRGRLYWPLPLISGSAGIRPTSTQRTACGAWLTRIATGLPAGVKFVIYSRKHNWGKVVNHWWVDDEWDTVRSRGLRATTRTTGTIP